MGTLTDDLAEVVRLSDKLPKDGKVSVTMYSDAAKAQIAASLFFHDHHAEILRNAEDAARYRWLRDHGDQVIGCDRGGMPQWTYDQELDVAVDAAMCTNMHTTPPKLAPEAGLEPATP